MKLMKVKKEDAVPSAQRLFDHPLERLDNIIKLIRPNGFVEKNVKEVIGPGAINDMKKARQFINKTYTILENLQKEYDANL